MAVAGRSKANSRRVVEMKCFIVGILLVVDNS